MTHTQLLYKERQASALYLAMFALIAVVTVSFVHASLRDIQNEPAVSAYAQPASTGIHQEKMLKQQLAFLGQR